jgi:hypothetical protein
MNKTKYIKCSRNEVREERVDLGGIEILLPFKYLGSVVNTNNTIEEEMKERTSAGNKEYFAHKIHFMSKTFSKESKLKLYKSIIRPVVICASKT